ncbi:uncharacterized protein LOC121760580 [Salvia splendens]|uniref:uncharacterized protein LOC121760580 n=1 Tax=Salvia splendens TaxID=180675 RepID=UPI001C264B0E|nr:uncharacterized protein LOC121760580 [Salvia splendens]
MEEQSEGSVGNQPPPPPPPPPQPQEREYIKAFRKENPPKFDGLGEPPKAEAWIRDLERILDFMGCTDRERLACVMYQLTGPADFSWETKRRTMNPARHEAFTWEEFKEEVYDKYIPMSYRRAKIVEFHTLKQGNMTVTEYDHALYVEEALPKDETTTNPTPPTPQPNYRDKRKWEDNRAPYDNKRHRSTFRQTQDYDRQAMPQPRGNQQKAPHCNRCSKYHFGECRAGGIRCFTCGGNGHMSRECPNNNKGEMWNRQGHGEQQQQPQPIRQVAPQQARAYALKGNEGQEQQTDKD